MSIETDDPRALSAAADEPVEDLDELSEVLPSAFAITSYGADYPVDGLVKRLIEGDIFVPLFSGDPVSGQSVVGFQREFVWTKAQADRFIESLLLGLPVPGIFLVKEGNNKLLVLDGHQRLETLRGFFEGVLRGTVFQLEAVQERWIGKTYKTLDPNDRRRIDNSIIHATIVRQDEPSEDQSSIYQIFERLNSGGTILQPQEIRVALYHGPFANLLNDLNQDENWRALYGRRNGRLKDVELILRFLALFYYHDNYQKPMKQFLNKYMSANRFLARQSEAEIKALFSNTMKVIRAGIGTRAFRPRTAVNAAAADSISVGVASRLRARDLTDPSALRKPYEGLLNSTGYATAITTSTADEESVRRRLRLARQAFEAV